MINTLHIENRWWIYASLYCVIIGPGNPLLPMWCQFSAFDFKYKVVQRKCHLENDSHFFQPLCLDMRWNLSCVIARVLKASTVQSLYYYTPRFNKFERGVYWFHLVRLSVCGQNRVRSVSSTILAHICISYQATSEGVLHVRFVLELKNRKFLQIL